ncbi:hypothetical protein FGA12_04570 [Shewanella marisflavi]|uniref:Apple domain-containing protein n=1 Tax=Shewanella marisflavi TaxID=260364 RepID=A0ABX5WXD9_9GAMM|nr:hypothetical protein FGA12_04570 [Shewanella marisflavi]
MTKYVTWADCVYKCYQHGYCSHAVTKPGRKPELCPLHSHLKAIFTTY